MFWTLNVLTTRHGLKAQCTNNTTPYFEIIKSSYFIKCFPFLSTKKNKILFYQKFVISIGICVWFWNQKGCFFHEHNGMEKWNHENNEALW